jgi:hypothetical protein
MHDGRSEITKFMVDYRSFIVDSYETGQEVLSFCGIE